MSNRSQGSSHLLFGLLALLWGVWMLKTAPFPQAGAPWSPQAWLQWASAGLAIAAGVLIVLLSLVAFLNPGPGWGNLAGRLAPLTMLALVTLASGLMGLSMILSLRQSPTALQQRLVGAGLYLAFSLYLAGRTWEAGRKFFAQLRDLWD